MKKQICEKCGGEKMIVSLNNIECKDCYFNGYQKYIEKDDDYIWAYDEKTRDGVEREEDCDRNRCKIGDAYGGGCVLLECAECGNMQNIPFSVC